MNIHRCIIHAIAAASLLLTGCGHTNNLDEYQFAGRAFLSESFVDPDAAEVYVSIDMPVEKDPVTGILVAIGEGVTSAKVERKLRAAVKPEGVASAIAAGFERDMVRYLELRAPETPGERPNFFVRTVLEQLHIASGASGIFLKIKAQTTIIDQASADVVWQDCEEAELPIRKTTAAAFVPILSTGVSIAHLVELLKLSDEELQDAVLQTALQVGTIMGETLRQDVAKMRR